MAKSLLTALFAISLCHTVFQPDSGTVSIEVRNLRNDKGYVLISLYDNDNDFPDKASSAVSKARVKIKNGVANVDFQNLKTGNYAVAILHDENNNLKMDFNIIGMPREGYGFSNDAKGTFGPPSFNKASFELKAEIKRVNIKATYLL